MDPSINTTTINIIIMSTPFHNTLLPYSKESGETTTDFIYRVTSHGKRTNSTGEEIEDAINEGLKGHSEKAVIDAENRSTAAATVEINVESNYAASPLSDGLETNKKPKRKLHDFAHSIFVMIALAAVLLLFIRHFTVEAAESHHDE